MHYYKKNIGDYAKKTGRLSMLQHGAYTLLIDACYDRERFPTLEEAIDWTWASSKEEIEAVEFVIRKFFTLENGVYVQNRIREEIAEYHLKTATNKRIAIEREAKRGEKQEKHERAAHDTCTNREHNVNEAPPNQEPRTKNQEPVTKNQEKKKSGGARGTRLDPAQGPPPEWIEFCKAERQDLDPAKTWARFADYWRAAPGSKGVKSDWAATWRNWVRNEKPDRFPVAVREVRQAETFRERDQRLMRERWEEATGQRGPPGHGNVIDITPVQGSQAERIA